MSTLSNSEITNQRKRGSYWKRGGLENKYCCLDPITLKFLLTLRERRLQKGWRCDELDKELQAAKLAYIRIEQKIERAKRDFNIETFPRISVCRLLDLSDIFNYHEMRQSLNYRLRTFKAYHNFMMRLRIRIRTLGLTYEDMGEGMLSCPSTLSAAFSLAGIKKRLASLELIYRVDQYLTKEWEMYTSTVET